MAIRVGRSNLTYADFLELPDDDNRYEIIDGELYVSPAPSTKHQRAATNLTTALNIHVRTRRLGEIFAAPTDVKFSDDAVVEPDIIYISRARHAIVTDPNIQGAPDLVVEVISPSSTRTDQETKRDLYAKYGVQHYWLVHPLEEWVRAFELGADGQYELVAEGNADAIFSAPPFPDLAIDLAELWGSYLDQDD